MLRSFQLFFATAYTRRYKLNTIRTRMKRYILPKVLLCITLIFILGCQPGYIKYDLPEKNPTRYIFNADIEKIKTVLYDRFRDRNFYGLQFRFAEDSTYTRLMLKYLKNCNSYDGILYTIGAFNSSIYYNQEVPLDYHADFHIHINKIDNFKTEIEIITFKSYIYIGETWYSGLFHVFGHAFFDTEDVDPSTVEEYQILLEIGAGLGVKDQMPEIILPDKNNIG